MKHFNINGKVHAFEEDGSQDHKIPSGAKEITYEEASLAVSQSLSDVEKIKADRDSKILALTVEVNGFLFDANEVSQHRMSTRLASTASDDELIDWKLHDNTHAEVLASDFRAALKKASEKTTKIWFGEA